MTPTTGGAAGGSGSAIAVTLSEFAIAPAAITATAGHQTFNVTNTGKFPHNFTITVGDKTVATKTLNGGESATLEADLTAGTYPTACTVPGHKDKGMVGTIVVK